MRPSLTISVGPAPDIVAACTRRARSLDAYRSESGGSSQSSDQGVKTVAAICRTPPLSCIGSSARLK